MFQIFDCNNKPVGRTNGYAKHATAERLITRPGSIRRSIYDAFANAKSNNPEHKHVYSIRWVESVDPVEFMKTHFQIIHIK